MPSFKTLGVRWPNISTVEDHVTGEAYCEIHLRIELDKSLGKRDDKKVTITNVLDAIEKDKADQKKTLPTLKSVLNKALQRPRPHPPRNTKGNRDLIAALSLE